MSPKETLRGKIKSRLEETSPEEFRTQGKSAAELLRSSPVWPCYETIFLFLSMNSEIDTRSLLEAALEDRKKAFAPTVEGEKLVFRPILSAEGPWKRGAFGIREPSGSVEQATASFPALIVAPGLAFDRDGNRLGKGKGYYDRFLKELETGGRQYAALGLCMDFQIVERVPVKENDKKMDYLLTKNELKDIRKL